MSLKKYEALVRTVDAGGVTLAAKEMGLTQSGVSHMLKALETELGVPLLDRSRAGVKLTPAGEAALPLMREILAGDRAMRERLSHWSACAGGTVRVGAFTSVAVHWLPGIIKEFSLRCPSVDFAMFNGDYHDMDRFLQDGSIDVGFVTLPGPKGSRCIKLSEDELVAVLPPNHPLAENEAVDIAAFAKEPFITLLHTSDHDIHRALDKAGIRPNVRFTTKDDYAIVAMVEQGLGVSVVPRLLLRGLTANVAVRPLLPKATRTIALAVPRGAKLSPAVSAFADFVPQYIAAHPIVP